METLSYLQKALEIKVAFVIIGGAIIIVSIQTLRDQALLAGVAIGAAFATAVPLALWFWSYTHRIKPFAVSR